MQLPVSPFILLVARNCHYSHNDQYNFFDDQCMEDLTYVPEFMPQMNRPMMNIAGWTANDCKITAKKITRLLSNMVYFLKEIRNWKLSYNHTHMHFCLPFEITMTHTTITNAHMGMLMYLELYK